MRSHFNPSLNVVFWPENFHHNCRPIRSGYYFLIKALNIDKRANFDTKFFSRYMTPSTFASSPDMEKHFQAGARKEWGEKKSKQSKTNCEWRRPRVCEVYPSRVRAMLANICKHLVVTWTWIWCIRLSVCRLVSNEWSVAAHEMLSIPICSSGCRFVRCGCCLRFFFTLFVLILLFPHTLALESD